MNWHLRVATFPPQRQRTSPRSTAAITGLFSLGLPIIAVADVATGASHPPWWQIALVTAVLTLFLGAAMLRYLRSHGRKSGDTAASLQAEAMRREEAELNYEKLFGQVPTALVLVRPSDGLIFDCNAAFADMLGRPKDEITGKTGTQLALWVRPEQREVVLEHLRNLDVVKNFDTDIRALDGATRHCTASTVVVQHDGEPAVLAALLDVTSIKESRNAQRALAAEVSKREVAEYNYQTSFEHVPAALVLVHPSSGDFLECNTAFAALLDMPKSAIIGQTAKDPELWVRPEQHLIALNHLKKVNVVRNVEVELRAFGGPVRHCRYSTAIVQHQGEPVILAALLDLTSMEESKNAQRELETQLQHMQALDDLGTLSSSIAHDFNNALSVVLGYTELATLQKDVPSKIRDYVDEVNTAGQHAKSLIAQLMAFSRKSSSNEAEINLISVTQEVVRFLEATLPKKYVVQFAPAIESAIAFGNPSQLHQVLLNLGTNAIQAMPDGGVLEFGIGRTQVDQRRALTAGDVDAGEYFVLSVKDTGFGMAADLLPRIFEPFFTTKVKGKGTGLGLSTILKIVTSVGGGIQVSSAIGEGASFQLYWPVSSAGDVESARRGDSIAPGAGQRILIVDDNQSIAELYSQILSGAGYVTTRCFSAEDALQKFRECDDCFDLILTDYDMPELTGMQLAEEVSAVSPEVPVVIISGSVQTDAVVSDRSIAVERFLVKPVAPQELQIAVAEILAGN